VAAIDIYQYNHSTTPLINAFPTWGTHVHTCRVNMFQARHDMVLTVWGGKALSSRVGINLPSEFGQKVKGT
jgi:hypothetical protein